MFGKIGVLFTAIYIIIFLVYIGLIIFTNGYYYELQMIFHVVGLVALILLAIDKITNDD